jgi:RNA polymerase sigma-70 factor (ECF subfamily)
MSAGATPHGTTGAASGAAASFEPHRRHLTGVAYRMLGTLSEAEDVVQDAYLRWHAADRAKVDNPRAYLSRTVTRLCLDLLKSARVRREQYVGPWLPEPVLDDAALAVDAPGELAADLSVALMLALERLSPLERAAFLLHDVFDMDYAEVAKTLDRNEAACRQLAARARAHVRDTRPRFAVSADDGDRIAEAFLAAARTGDAGQLAGLLAEDAILWSDGGGKKAAALNPIHGAGRIARFFAGIVDKAPVLTSVRFARVNGLPGAVAIEADGSPYVVSVEVRAGKVVAVYILRNPDKLRHVTA